MDEMAEDRNRLSEASIDKMNTDNFAHKVTSNEGHLLLEAIIDYAIYLVDGGGTILSWNAGGEKITGYAPGDAIGKPCTFMLPQDEPPQTFLSLLETARRSGRSEYEGWHVRKDGGRFWALSAIYRVEGNDRMADGFAVVSRDVTERHNAQEELIAQERRFHFLVDGVVDYAIYILTPEGYISNWNSGAQRIKGYSTDEILGKHFSLFYTESDRAKGLPDFALRKAKEEGKYEAEGWRVRKDGTQFWANVIVDAIFDDNGTLIGYAKVTRDITERREAQAVLEQAREQLFHAQKMEAMGQLTGGMAHDFNNLLTIIISGTDLVARNLSNPERATRFLDSIRQAARHGENLTKHLLAFSRRQPLMPELVNIKECLNELTDSLLSSLRGDITIEKDFEHALWRVEVDPHQLHLALLNISLNARDAMPTGGRISIRARNQLLQNSQHDLQAGDYVAISITDTGIGIPAEIKDRIFDPFFTTKPTGTGTGLGLSQAYGFARQSGGSMSVSSIEGQGTTMTMYLPASHREEKRGKGSDGARAVVLIVEDNVVLADMGAEILNDAGYEILRATDVQSALDVLRAQPVDVVLSDIVMPGGKSGLDLASELEVSFPSVKCVLMTGYSAKLALPRRDTLHILLKPFDQDALIKAIDDALDRR